MRSEFKFLLSVSIFTILVIPLLFNKSTITADAGPLQQDQYLAFAEVMPEVEGGITSLYKNIKYPAIAKKAGIEGKVYVMAFINENGAVDDVKVIKGIGGGCDEAAIAALKRAKFQPASNQGKTVKVKMSLPINFQLK